MKYPFIILVILTGSILTIFFFKRSNSKSTALERFYQKGDADFIINKVNEFSKISSRIMGLNYKPADLPILFPKGINGNKKDSMGSIKVRLFQAVPVLVEDSLLREVWENLYYEINRYKIQLDDDLVEAINNVFMFFTQECVIDRITKSGSQNYAEKIIYNRNFIGKWVALTKVLEAKINRRMNFFFK